MSASLEKENEYGHSGSGFWSYTKYKELDFMPKGALQWWLLFLIVWIYCIEQFEQLKIGTVLVYVMKDFGIDLKIWGYVGFIGYFVRSFGAYIFSSFTEKYGRRTFIIYPVAAYACVALLQTTNSNFYVFAGLYILGSFIMAGAAPAVLAGIRDIMPPVGRGIAYGFLSMGITGGSLLATTTSAMTLGIWPGWKPQFFMEAIVGALTVLMGIFWFRDLSKNQLARLGQERLKAFQGGVAAAGLGQLTPAEQLTHGKLVYKDWRIWVLGSCMLFWAIAYVTVANFVPTYLVQFHGIAPATAAGLASIYWITFTIALFFSGWASDVLQTRKTVLAFGCATTGIMFFVLAMVPKGVPLVTFSIIWGVLGVMAGGIYPAWCALVAEHAESVSPFGVARAFGITSIVSSFGGAILNLGVPFVVGNWGWPTWIVLAGISCFCIGIAGAAGYGRWWVPASERAANRAAA